MKHSFHVFYHGLKTFERDKRLGFASAFMFPYHDETLELEFHISHVYTVAGTLSISFVFSNTLSRDRHQPWGGGGGGYRLDYKISLFSDEFYFDTRVTYSKGPE